jgi:trimeric autotransporter adhesin
MPLCPQITITPITVTSTGMSTNNVIPNVFVNTEELDSVASSVAGKTKTYRQASAPTGTDINDGDLWFDTDDGNKLYMRVSGEWVSVQDLAIAAAQTTADGKNKIFRSPTPPTATAIGDTWFDTANGNKLYFWNGTAWIDVQDDAISAAQATADSKVKTFYQASAPTASEVGDIWFDTDDGFKQYFWNGSAWTSVQDTAIAAANNAAQAAQNTADGKNKIYRQATAPTGSFSVGDLWFNTAEDNKPNRWNGSAWEAYGFGNLAIGNLDAGKITTGFLGAARIEAASLDANKIIAGTITASQIAASTITGSKIAAATLTADNIAANTIVASKIAAGTITATQIAFATITGDQIAAETITALEIAAESITVDRLSAGTLTAFTLQTSTGTRRVTISAANNAISFREAGSVVGWVGPASISGIVMHYGATFTPGVTAYPNAYVSDGDARIAFSSTKYVQVSTTGVVMSGDVYSLTNFYNQDTTTTANAANTWMSATNGLTRRSTASSLRYKDNVVDLRTIADIDPKKLLNVPVRAFSYKTDYLDAADDRAGLMLPGFIAEEMAEIYPIAADKVDGVIESWNDRFVVPGMLALIQDLYARVKILENK